MAYQTGVLKYRGSFKSIRNWKYINDSKIYGGENGGANRDLILTNPAFVRTRENMAEFKGCGIAVNAIRLGLIHLLPEYADKQFTGRLVDLVKKINLRDETGTRGSRAIPFSLNRPMLKTLTLHEKRKIDFLLKKCITRSHPEVRTEATITVNGLNPGPAFVPGSPQFYRVIHHLSVISDYAYSEKMCGYEPLNKVNGASAYAYSDYTPINTPLSVALKVAFPVGTVLTETDTVLQCVGIEYYNRSGVDGYAPYATGCLLVSDVF